MNIIVGQSGGPTAVINASLAGIYASAKSLGISVVYGMRNGIEGLLEERYVKLEDTIKNDEDIKLLKQTPSAYLGSCRFKLPSIENNEKIYIDIFSILNKLDISAFLYIGGNDSMDTINKLSVYGKSIDSHIRFIGVPKTIDNDLVCTDHSPGYGSAAKYIATSMKEIIRDNKVNNQDVVSIVEIMGRDAGWLTGASILSKGEDCKGPDLIYLPEVVFNIESFLDSVDSLRKQNRVVIVAVSEGIRTEDGRYVCEHDDFARSTDSFGHTQLTGTSRVLANLVAHKIGCKVRSIEFSSMQRCAAHIPSLTDLDEAYEVGCEAIKAATEGYSGMFIQLNRVGDNPYRCELALCDVSLVANLKKSVPVEWITSSANYLNENFINYAKPLIFGEASIEYSDGLPRHIPYLEYEGLC